MDITFALDYTDQKPNGYAQVFAGCRADAALGVPAVRRRSSPTSATRRRARDPFDRLIDHDTPWKSGNEMGGVSANVDVEVGPGTLTSTTSWRFWNWDPSNDRDYLGLPVGTLSQAPSTHEQMTQEIRWAGDLSDKLQRRLRLLRLRSEAQHRSRAHGAGGRGSLSLPVDGAEHARGGDAGAVRRLHERDHVGAQHGERGAVRPDRLGHHGPAAPVAGLALQLRPEGRRLRSARLGRAGQPDGGGAAAAAQRLSAAGVRRRRRRLQHLGAIDAAVRRDGSNQRVRDVRDGLQVRRRQLGRPAARRQQPDGALGGRGGARGREAISRSASRRARRRARRPI